MFLLNDLTILGQGGVTFSIYFDLSVFILGRCNGFTDFAALQQYFKLKGTVLQMLKS